MTLRRRNFLGLIGAAMAAPLMPVAASAAGYSRSSYGLALAHAKKYPFVSVRGLSARLGVSATQAEAMITKMSSEGTLGIVKSSRVGTGHAVSRVFENQTLVPMRMSKPAAKPAPKRKQPVQTRANVDLMLAHLRDLCIQRGMPLSPRCYMGAYA